jgi:6-phosphogluconolactonase
VLIKLNNNKIEETRCFASFGEDWRYLATKEIRSAVDLSIIKNGKCTMMLTGGNTARILYRYWHECKTWDRYNIIFFIGDERCVPLSHPESNSGMVLRTLHPPDGSAHLFDIGVKDNDYEKIANQYEEGLPESIDVLLLSVGEDGHIASLFPNSDALEETERKYVPIRSKKYPEKRITITPRVIKAAKSVFLLVIGEKKGKIMSQMIGSKGGVDALPVELAINRTWIFDKSAGSIVMNRYYDID